jgi:hypothetical protein
MGRAEMLARMDSQELSGFRALLTLHHYEREEEAERQRLTADSDDGEVKVFGTPPKEWADDSDEDDGGSPDDDSGAT